MKYKVGDKVRVRGDLEVGEKYGSRKFVGALAKYRGMIGEIADVTSYGEYIIHGMCYYYSDEMLRPAEFKIWCESEAELKSVLDEINNEKYFEKHEAEYWHVAPVGIIVEEIKNEHQCVVRQCIYKSCFDERYDKLTELTPSEFTGLDFSEKIIISKTPTGATTTYGDKTVIAEGDFEDASRQALAEALCPFKVGDDVISKLLKIYGKVEKVQIDGRITVRFSNSSLMTCYDYELELYTKPLYNAKLFCIKGSDRFKVGYVYEVKNGMFNDTSTVFNDLNDINGFCSAQFMEIKGGLDD